MADYCIIKPRILQSGVGTVQQRAKLLHDTGGDNTVGYEYI